MNNIKKTIIISILVITLFSIGIFLTKNNIFAGDITGPGSVTASLHTLSDIYNRLTTNATATAGNHSLAPSANPASTFHSLTDIYDAIPTIDASKVLFGTTYLGVAGTATTTVSTLCYDNTYYYNDLSSCSENYACDSSFNGTYTADGIVVNEGTCETGDVCYDGSNYYSNMSSCSNDDECDSDIASSYSADGLICSAECVVNGDVVDGQPCCNNLNCDSGDCTDNVCVTVGPVCGNGIVEDGEDCECGVGIFSPEDEWCMAGCYVGATSCEFMAGPTTCNDCVESIEGEEEIEEPGEGDDFPEEIEEPEPGEEDDPNLVPV